ncbi:hypothetical protein SAMN04489729_4248 [Amycolatopsis lurida]|uniref:Lipoprotein n=1 Tax=Amycolatopsis lurida NRRL 2430 TaxID=1460371 RepID=A0A2P2G1S1_AMYLU|nr:hypothetical protein [Amycolatopsis lurida]KFU82922.1 hypothetical protein BB31_00070 [Amycolatopsis lurida NRRL 2430]SED40276.1 hypothetical protein SAMN04489729_4248 [Amycolatopsis lurida]
MTTAKTVTAQQNLRRALCAGLAAAGLLTGCVPASNVPAGPEPSAPVRWFIDHLSAPGDTTIRPVSTYTAFCASTDMVTPSHLPQPHELQAVTVTKAEFARLQEGDPCPLETGDGR